MCTNPCKENIRIKNLGIVPYEEAREMQLRLFNELIEQKRAGEDVEKEYLIMLEHFPVITMGKHAHEYNLIADSQLLKQKNIKCFRIERGGDVTYHGPGQLVVYPILDLEKHHLGVKRYVELIEETVIQLIAQYGLKGERVAGASGVWLDAGTKNERKICALGIKCSRFVTMHGLALNVNTDLQGFNLINPCGFVDKGVTSMQKELGEKLDMEEVKTRFQNIFLTLLQE